MRRAGANTLRLRSVRRLSGVALLLLLLAAFTRPSGVSAARLPAAATPEEAVTFAVESLGGTYAGACDATRTPESRGKICSRYVAACGDLRAYLLGRTFSEYNTWLFIVQAHDGWHFDRTEPLGLTDSLTNVPWPIDTAVESCP
jgi:hypothetical protein